MTDPTIADLLAAMAPEDRERCEDLIRRLCAAFLPRTPQRRPRARPRATVEMPADVRPEEVAHVRVARSTRAGIAEDRDQHGGAVGERRAERRNRARSG